MLHLSRRSLLKVGAAALLVPALGTANPTQARQIVQSYGGAQWLSAASLHPTTIWIGGDDWAEGSSDGGRTWHDVSGALDDAAQNSGCSFTRNPAVLDGPGKQIAIEEDGNCTTASSTYVLVLYSADGGKKWSAIGPSDPSGYGAGTAAPAFAPMAPYQAWLVDVGGNGDTKEVARLVNGGPQDGSNPASAFPNYQYDDDITSLVPDPHGGSGIFANASGSNGNYVTYSAHGGSNWKVVAASRGVQNFAVAADPLVAGGLVATSYDGKSPSDRRWYSVDGGKQWQAGECAGDYKAICPTAILPAGTPGGLSVAINGHGAYTFRGDAGTSGKAAISLPVPARRILAAQGDLRRGDPIYLLTTGGKIYRSLDSGKSWTAIWP